MVIMKDKADAAISKTVRSLFRIILSRKRSITSRYKFYLKDFILNYCNFPGLKKSEYNLFKLIFVLTFTQSAYIIWKAKQNTTSKLKWLAEFLEP